MNETVKSISRLVDYDHPLVRETVARLTKREVSLHGKLEKVFYYVRDEIRFGFPEDGDLVKASDTIRLRMGQCNTKAALFLALCKAVRIPARIHFSLIKKEIQRGLFTGIGYALMPSLLSHSWVEVKIDGTWRKLDSFINDKAFYIAGRKALREKGWDTGYSISCSGGESSADFNIEEEKFVQMDAVAIDQGVWDNPSDYYESDKYRNRPNRIKLFVYKLMIKRINHRVARMRSESFIEDDDRDGK